jgi:hypothetical protein
VEMTFGQVEIVRLLPTGERTDHLPGDVVPHEEQVRQRVPGQIQDLVRERVPDRVPDRVRDRGNQGGGR